MKYQTIMKKNILITGAAGFIGFYLLKKYVLNPNYKITIIDNFSRGKKDKEFRQSCLYKKKKIIVKNMDLIKIIYKIFLIFFYLAAIVGVNNVKKETIKTFDTNLVSTVNIINSPPLKIKKGNLYLFSSQQGNLSPYSIIKTKVSTSETRNLFTLQS